MPITLSSAAKEPLPLPLLLLPLPLPALPLLPLPGDEELQPDGCLEGGEGGQVRTEVPSNPPPPPRVLQGSRQFLLYGPPPRHTGWI